MFDKIKGIGTQIGSLATTAADGVAASVKEHAGTIADATTAAASTLSEKAIRAAVEQMRTVLKIAGEEVRQRPISEHPVTLTASVHIGVTALEMQIVIPKASSPIASASDAQEALPGPAPDTKPH